jgi:hypothetical protein
LLIFEGHVEGAVSVEMDQMLDEQSINSGEYLGNLDENRDFQ